MKSLQIDCISDTHLKHEQFNLLGGDILIHAGDCTSSGSLKEAQSFLNWFKKLDYFHLILIPGNHDFVFEKDPELMKKECEIRGVHLLMNSGIEIEGIKIWGSPITPCFNNWAFNRSRGEAIKKYWDLIPIDTEILVTHGPPYGILDKKAGSPSLHLGCEELYKKVIISNVKVHLFGHIHESRGVKIIDDRIFMNASALDEYYVSYPNPYFTLIKDSGKYLIKEL